MILGCVYKIGKDKSDLIKCLNIPNEISSKSDVNFISSNILKDYIKTHRFSFFNDYCRLLLLRLSLLEESSKEDIMQLIKDNYLFGVNLTLKEELLENCLFLNLKGKTEELNLFLNRINDRKNLKSVYRNYFRITDINNPDKIMSDEYKSDFLKYVQCLFAKYAAEKSDSKKAEELSAVAEKIASEFENSYKYKEDIIALAERLDKENE